MFLIHRENNLFTHLESVRDASSTAFVTECSFYAGLSARAIAAKHERGVNFSARASKKAPLGPSKHCGRSEKLAPHESRTSPSSSQTQSYLSPVMSIRTDSDLDGRVYERLQMCAAPTHASGGAHIYRACTHVVCLRLATGARAPSLERGSQAKKPPRGEGGGGDLCLFKVKLSAGFTFLPHDGS